MFFIFQRCKSFKIFIQAVEGDCPFFYGQFVEGVNLVKEFGLDFAVGDFSVELLGHFEVLGIFFIVEGVEVQAS